MPLLAATSTYNVINEITKELTVQFLDWFSINLPSTNITHFTVYNKSKLPKHATDVVKTKTLIYIPTHMNNYNGPPSAFKHSTGHRTSAQKS